MKIRVFVRQTNGAALVEFSIVEPLPAPVDLGKRIPVYATGPAIVTLDPAKAHPLFREPIGYTYEHLLDRDE